MHGTVTGVEWCGLPIWEGERKGEREEGKERKREGGVSGGGIEIERREGRQGR